MDTDTRNADTPRTTGDDDAPVVMSAPRRVGITLFVLLTLVAMATNLMPPSVLGARVATVTAPYSLATGLEQNWGMFAPNPQQISTAVRARVDRADGSTAYYAVPHGRGLTAYWDYRWLKYGDQIADDKQDAGQRVAFARWAVQQDRAAGGDPVRVTLLRFAQRLFPPGPGPDEGPPQENPIYTAALDGRR
jgi:hypothetical protein